MYTTQVKTEKVEDVGSPANSWTGDEEISVNSKHNEKTLTTIAIVSKQSFKECIHYFYI